MNEDVGYTPCTIVVVEYHAVHSKAFAPTCRCTWPVRYGLHGTEQRRKQLLAARFRAADFGLANNTSTISTRWPSGLAVLDVGTVAASPCALPVRI